MEHVEFPLKCPYYVVVWLKVPFYYRKWYLRCPREENLSFELRNGQKWSFLAPLNLEVYKTIPPFPAQIETPLKPH